MKRSYSTSKEIHVLVKQLVEQGWAFWRGTKHGRLQMPGSERILSVPCSPSDHRAFLNFRRDVRQLLSANGARY